MKKKFIVLVCCFLFSSKILASSDLSLIDILNLDVTTASKSKEKINRSTSVMSVITKNQIKLSGLRSVYDLLKRVTGFFPTNQVTWSVVGSRGFVADGTDHILLLVDGHRQNSILENGYQQQDTIPSLEKVERIEIIRGPGSVLWGSSAAWGIINIITQDGVGANGDGTEISMTYGHANKLGSANLLQGLKGEDYSGIVSFTAWNASGYIDEERPNMRLPWSNASYLTPPVDKQFPSFDFYSKLKLGKHHEIKARLFDQNVVYPWDSLSSSSGVKPGSKLRTRKAYLDYTYKKDFFDNWSISQNIYADMNLQLRHPETPQVNHSDTRWIEDMSREETAVGYEVSGNYKDAKHDFTVGLQYIRTEVGPNRSNRFDTSTNLPTTPTGTEQQVNVIGVLPAVDNSLSTYFQEKYSISEDTDVFTGLRLDYNDYREHGVKLLPRAGIINQVTESFNWKYIFNTGYLRPNAVYSRNGGKFFRAPSKTIENVNVVNRSEKIFTHDLQFFWGKEKSYFSVTFFYSKINDYISWETVTDLGYRTLGDAQSYGIEVEGRHPLTESIDLYGNFSASKAQLDKVGTVSVPTSVSASGQSSLAFAVSDEDGDWLNYPTFLYNLGTDISFSQNSYLNFHLRGWQHMRIKGSYENPLKRVLKGEFYFDINYNVLNLAKNMDISFFVMNILDNQHSVGTVINNGEYSPIGRNIGSSLIYKF